MTSLEHEAFHECSYREHKDKADTGIDWVQQVKIPDQETGNNKNDFGCKGKIIPEKGTVKIFPTGWKRKALEGAANQDYGEANSSQ